MKRSSGPRKTASNLPETVHQHLNMYALAASAAGVSLLALSKPAEAKIVYTKANVSIGRGQHYNLDLNHDGKSDFRISNSVLGYGCMNLRSQEVFELPTKGNGAMGSVGYADALSAGSRIGNSRGFSGGKGVMARFSAKYVFGFCSPVYLGGWFNVTERFLGLKFKIHGKTHFGWARLSVQWFGGSRGFSATLTGYAYETITSKSIKAGQTHGKADDLTKGDFPGSSLTVPIPDNQRPSSLGMLALGAQGVPLWRRKESAPEGSRN